MVTKEEKREQVMKILSVTDKQALLKQRRSGAEKIFRKASRSKAFTPKLGAGKGLEPKDQWCPCHNRAPCPIDIELMGGSMVS